MKLLPIVFSAAFADKNGGAACAACGIIGGWLEQYGTANGKSGSETIADMCRFLPTDLERVCNVAISLLGDIVDLAITSNDHTADTICHCLNLCKVSDGYDKVCHLFPMPDYALSNPTEKCPSWTKHPLIRQSAAYAQASEWEKLLELLKEHELTRQIVFDLQENWEDFSTYKQPFFDDDKDGFSEKTRGAGQGVMRGYWWRGLDCNGRDETVYPGRKPNNDDRYADTNCNGVSGVDEFDIPLESKYCSNSYEAKGVAVLGDSASAHFGIPVRWMRPAEFNESTFETIFMSLANELDWPMQNWATGMSDNCWEDDLPHFGGDDLPSQSIYRRYVEWNRCALNDYQTQAQNGAKAKSMADKLVLGLTRKQDIDKPQIVFLSLIGNDVCNGRYPTEPNFTTEEEFRTKTLQTLDHLDKILPSGSHVIMTGLADGRVLWDFMSQRIHPLGEYRSDVTYEDVYEYLNCLQISPCHGWMTADADLRDRTSQRAFELSQVAKDIAEGTNYEHFEMLYYDFDIEESMRIWESRGGEGWQLVDPVDGFHPSQTAQRIQAELFWEQIMQDKPQVFGEENPFNELIKRAQKNSFGVNTC